MQSALLASAPYLVAGAVWTQVACSKPIVAGYEYSVVAHPRYQSVLAGMTHRFCCEPQGALASGESVCRTTQSWDTPLGDTTTDQSAYCTRHLPLAHRVSIVGAVEHLIWSMRPVHAFFARLRVYLIAVCVLLHRHSCRTGAWCNRKQAHARIRSSDRWLPRARPSYRTLR
jgi:hypothetical protein